MSVCPCVSGCTSCPRAVKHEQGAQQLPPTTSLLIAGIPSGEGCLRCRVPLYRMGSLALRLQLELSNSHFSFIKLTNKCPAGEQASCIDSAPPLGLISLLHFNIY